MVGEVEVEGGWCARLVCVIGVVVVVGEGFATHMFAFGVVKVEGVWFAALVVVVVGSGLGDQVGTGVEVMMIVEEEGDSGLVSESLHRFCWSI